MPILEFRRRFIDTVMEWHTVGYEVLLPDLVAVCNPRESLPASLRPHHTELACR